MTKKQSRKLASRIRSVKKSLRTSENRYFHCCKDTWTHYYETQKCIMITRELLDKMDEAYRAAAGDWKL